MLADIINKWIYLAKDSPSFKKKYDCWIMGIGAEDTEPRWSVMGNVLDWGVEEENDQEEPSAEVIE